MDLVASGGWSCLTAPGERVQVGAAADMNDLYETKEMKSLTILGKFIWDLIAISLLSTWLDASWWREHKISNNIPASRGIPLESEGKFPSSLKHALFFIGTHNASFHSFHSSEWV